MQASQVSTPIAGHIGTIFVSIELSQKDWLVTLHSPDHDRMSHHKVGAGDGAGLLSLLERVGERAGRKLGTVPRVKSCYEAGYDGFWLHRFLQANGVENYVFDPASIAVEQRSRRAKTDRIDGEQLVRTLMAHCRGEPRVVRIVRVPSADQEDARRTTRERDRLVGKQTAHTNRLKGLLRLHGFAVGNPRRRDWLRWLAGQRDWQGCPVPPQQLAEIEREHARLMLVREQLAALEKPCAEAPSTPAAVEMGRRQKMLFRLKSLGPAFTTFPHGRGVLQGLHQWATGGELFWLGAQSLEERRDRPGARDQQGRQSACPPEGDRARLAVGAPPARQRAHALVP